MAFDPWAGYPPGAVVIRLQPLSDYQEVRRFAMWDDANGKQLGILCLNSDEVRYLERRLTFEGTEPTFQQWLADKLNNPNGWMVNGKLLSSMSLAEQLNTLYSYWNASLQVSPLDGRNGPRNYHLDPVDCRGRVQD